MWRVSLLFAVSLICVAECAPLCNTLTLPKTWLTIQAFGGEGIVYNASKTDYCFSRSTNSPYMETVSVHVDLADSTAVSQWDTLTVHFYNNNETNTCINQYNLTNCFSKCKDPSVESALVGAVLTTDPLAMGPHSTLDLAKANMAALNKQDWPIYAFHADQPYENHISYQYYMDNNFCAVLAERHVPTNGGSYIVNYFIVTNKNI